jgi:FMN reductase
MPLKKYIDSQTVKVIAICGSLRKGSYTKAALNVALEGARSEGAEIELIDLRNYHLVFFGEMEEADYPPDVQKLRNIVRAADGILLGTPEYHAGISGVLKNALDLMSFDEFEGKIIGLIGVSGGSMGAINALNSLRTIGRNLHAWVLPQQVSIPEAYRHFDAVGLPVDPEIKERLLEVGRLVTRFAKLLEIQKNQDFIKLWEGLPENPGGRKP